MTDRHVVCGGASPVAARPPEAFVMQGRGQFQRGFTERVQVTHVADDGYRSYECFEIRVVDTLTVHPEVVPLRCRIHTSRAVRRCDGKPLDVGTMLGIPQACETDCGSPTMYVVGRRERRGHAAPRLPCCGSHLRAWLQIVGPIEAGEYGRPRIPDGRPFGILPCGSDGLRLRYKVQNTTALLRLLDRDEAEVAVDYLFTRGRDRGRRAAARELVASASRPSECGRGRNARVRSRVVELMTPYRDRPLPIAPREQPVCAECSNCHPDVKAPALADLWRCRASVVEVKPPSVNPITGLRTPEVAVLRRCTDVNDAGQCERFEPMTLTQRVWRRREQVQAAAFVIICSSLLGLAVGIAAGGF